MSKKNKFVNQDIEEKMQEAAKETESEEEKAEEELSEEPKADPEETENSMEPETDEPEDPEEKEVTGEEAEEEEKPVKKERKLKWAGRSSQEADKKTEELKEKILEANDKYARLFAEFDNFRKRSEKEKSQRYDFGARDMVERILPVIDNFERGLAAVPEEKADDSFVTGMQMTYKQLLKVLEDAGVTPIEAVGKQFDPEFHNAVMHVDDPDAGENIIVEEFQKGYMYKDHVVRYSMVKVAN